MYWIHLTIIGVIAGYGIHRSLELRQFAQSCMTRAQVTSDSRCLYIYQTHVYQKGTKNNPHQGNACGSDVTSIIPSFHFMSAAVYLDPNLVGTLCSDISPTTVPTATPRPSSTPTVRPSNTLTPTLRPSSTPTLLPTSTLRPSSTPTLFPTSTLRPTNTPLITMVPTPTDTPIPTPTLPPIPGYPSWWSLIPVTLRNYLEVLYYWVFYYMRPADNAHILEGVFPTPTP